MTHTKSMRTINKLVASLMVAAMFAAAFMVSGHNASAADGTLNLTGGLTITSAPNFSFTLNAPYTGAANFATGTLSITVKDLTASDLGWNIKAWMSPMTTQINSVDHALTDAAVLTSDPSALASDVNSVTALSNIDFATEFTAFPSTALGKLKLFNATADTGEGTNVVTVPITQVIAANSAAGTYTATINIDITSAP